MNEWWRELRLRAKERLEDYVLGGTRRSRWALQHLDEEHVLHEGRRRALMAARRAFRKVPAYRDFLARHGVTSIHLPFEKLPIMAKDNYVRAYRTEERCLNGAYLSAGVAIDESSGSTGTPFNWVRGAQERRRVRRELARMLEFMFGKQPRIAINAFSMGAWATGVTMGEALELHSVVKSTGPDLEKILHTLEFFGPAPSYFICGYPPFLKLLLDSMRGRGFPLNDYALHALVGGEGMSEEFRRYLLRGFRSCYSGYGASDLEVGIAVETPEAVRIRGLLHDHHDLRGALLEGDHRVPMVFQYNPATHYIETNEENELIVTLNYSRILSPRIRYNIGDEGRLFTRRELLKRLRQLGYPLETQRDRALPFPYVFLYGRRDQTISLMGANIYPEDVERVLFAEPALAAGIASFAMSVEDAGNGDVHPRLCIEWSSERSPELPLQTLARRIEKELAEVNSDFRTAMQEYPGSLRFELLVFGFGQGPFTGKGRRIKNRYFNGSST